MIIKVIQTGETIQVNDSYGARLIEQGAAVFCPTEAEEKSTTPKKGGKKNGAD